LHDLKRAKLKVVNQYIIPFAGLKEGEHEFRFNFEKKFFDEHEILEARDGNLEAHVILHKKINLLNLEIVINGNLEIQCDKCLDFFFFPIQSTSTLIVQFGDDESASTDEIWILPPGKNELDLEQFFFECIGLCIPIKRVHPDKSDGTAGCNQKMLELLNVLTAHSSKITENDPRWNKLKNILNNTNNNKNGTS
jgi:uncharacterized protein